MKSGEGKELYISKSGAGTGTNGYKVDLKLCRRREENSSPSEQGGCGKSFSCEEQQKLSNFELEFHCFMGMLHNTASEARR